MAIGLHTHPTGNTVHEFRCADAGTGKRRGCPHWDLLSWSDFTSASQSSRPCACFSGSPSHSPRISSVSTLVPLVPIHLVRTTFIFGYYSSISFLTSLGASAFLSLGEAAPSPLPLDLSIVSLIHVRCCFFPAQDQENTPANSQVFLSHRKARAHPTVFPGRFEVCATDTGFWCTWLRVQSGEGDRADVLLKGSRSVGPKRYFSKQSTDEGGTRKTSRSFCDFFLSPAGSSF